MHTNGHDQAPTNEVNPVSLAQGHEPDRVDIRRILYVAAALVITFILSWTTVTLTINYVRAPSTEKPTNVLAANRNDAPLNARLNRISSDDAVKADSRQPRLDGLDRLRGLDQNRLDEYKKDNPSYDPPWVKSRERTKEGNSPDFHPEDLRPSSEHGKQLGLQGYSWSDKARNIVRIPIDQAMKLALTSKDPKNPKRDYLASENGLSPDSIRQVTPKPTTTEQPKAGLH